MPFSAVASVVPVVVVSLVMDIVGSPCGFARSPVGRAGPITVAFSRRRADGVRQQKPIGVCAPPGQPPRGVSAGGLRWGCVHPREARPAERTIRHTGPIGVTHRRSAGLIRRCQMNPRTVPALPPYLCMKRTTNHPQFPRQCLRRPMPGHRGGGCGYRQTHHRRGGRRPVADGGRAGPDAVERPSRAAARNPCHNRVSWHQEFSARSASGSPSRSTRPAWCSGWPSAPCRFWLTPCPPSPMSSARSQQVAGRWPSRPCYCCIRPSR